jgi:hypothetical protein
MKSTSTVKHQFVTFYKKFKLSSKHYYEHLNSLYETYIFNLINKSHRLLMSMSA